MSIINPGLSGMINYYISFIYPNLLKLLKKALYISFISTVDS
jgi:hypothetical protein